jgi:hypothetical protein
VQSAQRIQRLGVKRGRRAGENGRAQPGLARQQPLILEGAQGLAHSVAADAEAVAQLIFRGKFAADREGAGGDLRGQCLAKFHIARQRIGDPSIQ